MIEELKPEPINRSVYHFSEEERKATELWNAITTALVVAGHRGEDVVVLAIETLKKLGRYDLLPPCERRIIIDNKKVNYLTGKIADLLMEHCPMLDDMECTELAKAILDEVELTIGRIEND